MNLAQAVDYTVLISQLKIRYNKVRRQSISLVNPLEVEDFVAQPVTDVSPPKWHLAHVTWFFENFILIPQKKNYRPFNVNYSFLFNSYYVSLGQRWVRSDRGALTRPTVSEIIQYREYVDDHMNEWFDRVDELNPELMHVLEVGIQHEQQHQELLVYDIKRILGENPIFPVYNNQLKKDVDSVRHTSEWVGIEEGKYWIGHNEKEGFCFDNELGRHPVYLIPFSVCSDLVTNGEYLEFIEDRGYEHDLHWMMEGKEWIDSNKITAPKYWYNLDGKWHIYHLSGLEPIRLEEPVAHLSFYEADAFARWKGMRLPTEFEWEVFASSQVSDTVNEGNFVEDQYLRPLSIKSNVLGNLWEWTGSAYRPYPGYNPPTGALGEYNGKFMINQMVLRGGSYATARDHIRTTYRNFFHPNLQWLCSGVRLAKDL